MCMVGEVFKGKKKVFFTEYLRVTKLAFADTSFF